VFSPVLLPLVLSNTKAYSINFVKTEEGAVDCIFRIKHFYREEEKVFKNVINITNIPNFKENVFNEEAIFTTENLIYIISIDYDDGSYTFPSFSRNDNVLLFVQAAEKLIHGNSRSFSFDDDHTTVTAIATSSSFHSLSSFPSSSMLPCAVPVNCILPVVTINDNYGGAIVSATHHIY
jgi:hypothetical protein